MIKLKRIKDKLILYFSIVVLISSISGIVGTVLIINTDVKYSKALTENGFSQGEIGTFNTYLNKGSAVVRDIIFFTDANDINKSKQELQQINDKTTNAFEQMKLICKTDKELNYISEIDKKLPQYRKMRDEVVELGMTDKREEALELFHTQARPLLNQIMDTAQALAELNISIGQNVSKSLTLQSNITIVTIVSIILLSIIISIVFAIYVAKLFSKPVIKIKEASAQLASGDLNIELSVVSEDEIGQMANSFIEATKMLRTYISEINRGLAEISKGNFDIVTHVDFKGDFEQIKDSINTIIYSLSDTISKIAESSNQVALGSTQMSESSQNLAEGATEQAGAIEQLQATITDIVAQVESNVKDSEDTYNIAQITSKEAQTSGQQINDMATAMQQISNTSKQIVSIIAEIEEIASQTNLLSLNASIEAARAGESGKGFAVVANQIGKLANDSSQSASNTRRLIENSIKEVENGNQITAQTISSLKKVIDGILAVAEKSKSTNENLHMQKEAMHQIEQGISQISNVVQTNSAIAEETSSTSQELSAQSISLNELVNQFKLKE